MSDASPFFYVLVEDNHTAMLSALEPAWGRPLTGVSPAGRFEMTLWQHLKHVVTYRLGKHAMRTRDANAATCCVVASPAERTAGSECSGTGLAVYERLVSLGAQICPNKPIVVVDGPDADGTKDALCNSLWTPASCAKGRDDVLVRLSGNAPGLQSEVATRLRRGFCRYLAPTPYLAHARSAAAAASSTDTSSSSAARFRPLRIAYAAASWGHIDADKHGFLAWRKALRNACKKIGAANASSCEWVWISMSGQGAEKALQRYAHADFCLQPPGDTLPRPGILDSLTSGCIPVIFHPEQATLWPKHWRPLEEANPSGLLFDFTDGVPRPRVRDREHAKYAVRAQEALKSLLDMPGERLHALRRGVAIAARSVVYGRGDDAKAVRAGDAIDVIVEQSMRPLRRTPDSAEAAAYEHQLEHRQKLIDAQAGYEASRRRHHWHHGGGGGSGGASGLRGGGKRRRRGAE